jgi:hypothetical protein
MLDHCYQLLFPKRLQTNEINKLIGFYSLTLLMLSLKPSPHLDYSNQAGQGNGLDEKYMLQSHPTVAENHSKTESMEPDVYQNNIHMLITNPILLLD